MVGVRQSPRRPDRDENSTWSACSYPFADLRGSEIAYQLTVKLMRQSYSRAAFAEETELLAPWFKSVSGLGDVAHLLPAADADTPTAMFVLYDEKYFIVSVLEPPSVSAERTRSEIEAVAHKIVSRL